MRKRLASGYPPLWVQWAASAAVVLILAALANDPDAAARWGPWVVAAAVILALLVIWRIRR